MSNPSVIQWLILIIVDRLFTSYAMSTVQRNVYLTCIQAQVVNALIYLWIKYGETDMTWYDVYSTLTWCIRWNRNWWLPENEEPHCWGWQTNVNQMLLSFVQSVYSTRNISSLFGMRKWRDPALMIRVSPSHHDDDIDHSHHIDHDHHAYRWFIESDNHLIDHHQLKSELAISNKIITEL